MKFSVIEICNLQNTKTESYIFQNPKNKCIEACLIPTSTFIFNNYFKNHFLVRL